MEVSPETLARRDNWLDQQALRLLGWRDFPEAAAALARNGKILYLLGARLLPLYMHRYQVRKEAVALLGSLARPDPDLPVGEPPVPPPAPDPPPPPLTQELHAAQEAGLAVYTRELRDYRVGGVSARRLQRLLRRCRSLGLPVVLVGAPVSSPCRRAYTPEVNDAFLAYIGRLARLYPCVFTDWRDRVPDEFFIDAHHAGREGGVYFSRRFAGAVLVPLWREIGRGHEGVALP